ncbi:MAG: twin-arginine translocase subunit TatC [Verrucomicrobiota bacterium]|jgi:sec-independent protein translocase protein TatC
MLRYSACPMFLLKKVFQLRDKANPDAEKPFLEHLEDLRVMVTRVVVTLLITTVVCFTYRDQLMEILRKPISDVWEIHSANKLPKSGKLSADQWEVAKTGSEVLAHLPESLHELYLQQLAAEDRERVIVASCYRATISLPAEKQPAFVASLAALNAAQRSLLEELLVGKPDAMAGTRDRFKFMSSLNPTEAFMLSMKLAFFAGSVMAFPLLLYYVLQFILPGLHQHEKRAILPALGVGFGLFLCGVLFAYLWVLPSVLEFFYSYGESMGIANEWRIGYYLSFATQFTLIFGLCFELPVVVWVLVKIGLLNYELMSRTRGYAVVAIVVLAAVITPTPDAFTLGLLALPMILLYELSIWLAWFDARSQKKREQKEEEARLARLLSQPPTDTHTSHDNEKDPSSTDLDDLHSSYESYRTEENRERERDDSEESSERSE